MRVIPTWGENFMDMAKVVAKRSKDPSCQVGCVLVKDNRVISTGYNGFISGCDESLMTYDRPLKYFLILHAEINAAMFARREDLRGSICYCTAAPCENCLKYLLQAGVRKFYYEGNEPTIKRGSPEQKEAIKRLISSVPDCECRNVLTGNNYYTEIQASEL
jgi:dCMP deaminase